MASVEAHTDVQMTATEELGAVLRQYMDVTERLQRTHDVLQHEVIRLRDELASKNRELEIRRRLAALGELAAGVAHEVRNPLGAIQLYSGLLRRECRKLAPALPLIEKIELGVHAIEAVVKDTLALAPRPGHVQPRLLNELLEGAADVARPVLERLGVALNVKLDEPDAQVLAEGDGLQRVFVNLLVNAAEASARGAAIEVHAGAATQGEIAVRVLDCGMGLSEEVLERLFNPFFTTKDSGTGLGLTIAHRVVEALGGRLTARNRPQGGAEFNVVLPTSADAVERAANTDAARRTSAA